LTPIEVAQNHIFVINELEGLERKIWVDPFRNTGNYYNHFPEGVTKEWCEILDGKDALEYDYKDKVVVSNPPYSILTKCLKKMTNDGATVFPC
jgi:hypothetical protein